GHLARVGTCGPRGRASRAALRGAVCTPQGATRRDRNPSDRRLARAGGNAFVHARATMAAIAADDVECASRRHRPGQRRRHVPALVLQPAGPVLEPGRICPIPGRAGAWRLGRRLRPEMTRAAVDHLFRSAAWSAQPWATIYAYYYDPDKTDLLLD